jgi:hypothetical protein
MIKKALSSSLESGGIAPEELYGLDDQSLFALLKSPLAESVREGRFYLAAAEFPCPGDSPLRDLHNRSAYEKALTEKIRAAGIPAGDGDLIIDVPEPFSLETGLFVRDEGRCFEDSSSAFKGGTVGAFVSSLYTVRVFAVPAFGEKLAVLADLIGGFFG